MWANTRGTRGLPLNVPAMLWDRREPPATATLFLNPLSCTTCQDKASRILSPSLFGMARCQKGRWDLFFFGGVLLAAKLRTSHAKALSSRGGTSEKQISSPPPTMFFVQVIFGFVNFSRFRFLSLTDTISEFGPFARSG